MREWIVKCLTVMTSVLVFSATAHATTTGFYMGMDAGLAYNNGKPRPIYGLGYPATARPNKRIFTFGVLMGYDFVSYAGAELSANYFTKVDYNISVPLSSPSTAFGTVNILGKLMFPAGPFTIFGKAGGAIIFQKVSKTLIGANSSTNRHGLRPAFGLGASYDLTPNWVADLTWLQIRSVYLLNNVNMITLGITYHFVDRYCGQFLCD